LVVDLAVTLVVNVSSQMLTKHSSQARLPTTHVVAFCSLSRKGLDGFHLSRGK